MEQTAKYEVIPHNDNFAVEPKEQIAKASDNAKLLQTIVKQGGLSKNFGGQKDHLYFEAWQTIGAFYGCSPVVEWSRELRSPDGEKVIGWESKVNVVDGMGRVVSSAEAMCAEDEKNWKGRNQYALRSMAQTRAASKALRMRFAWVAVLAGYAPTPAEEMSAEFFEVPPEKPKSPPQSTQTDKPMSDAQKKKVYAMLKTEGLSDEEIRDLTGKHGLRKEQNPTSKQASDFFDHFAEVIQKFRNPEENWSSEPTDPPDEDLFKG